MRVVGDRDIDEGLRRMGTGDEPVTSRTVQRYYYFCIHSPGMHRLPARRVERLIGRRPLDGFGPPGRSQPARPGGHRIASEGPGRVPGHWAGRGASWGVLGAAAAVAEGGGPGSEGR